MKFQGIPKKISDFAALTPPPPPPPKTIDVAYFVADTSEDHEDFLRASDGLQNMAHELIGDFDLFLIECNSEKAKYVAEKFREKKQEIMGSVGNRIQIKAPATDDPTKIEHEASESEFRWVNGEPENNSPGVLVQAYDVHPDEADQIKQKLLDFFEKNLGA